MIERSKVLADRINSFVPATGTIAIWWLGQSGFVIRDHDYCIVTDPYLSTTLEDLTKDFGPEMKHIRMTPIPVNPWDLHCVDYVICSHDHGDHYDRASVEGILEGSPNCKVIGPPAVIAACLKDSISKERLISVGTEDEYTLGGLKITAMKAKHNNFDYSDEYGFPYVGYFIRLGSTCIYHAGDTILFDGIRELISKENVDIGLIPINGYDDQRVKAGFQSNFKYSEAADLAMDTGIKMMIPCHYDMFTANTEQVGNFVNYINSVRGMPAYKIPVIGSPLIFSKEVLGK